MEKPNLKNQYTLLVYLILLKYTYENHKIKQQQILKYLADDYHVVTQRRSISRALAVLADLGFDVVKNGKGVALLTRVFDEGQLEYVLDAVYSSPSIPPKEADKIFEQLTDTLPLEEKSRLARIEKEDERGKLANPHIFYEIGAISEAIGHKCLIEFTYKSYDEKGDLVPMINNPQRVLPIKTFLRDGRYCLLAGETEQKALLRLYIDRMFDVKEIPQDLKRPVFYSPTEIADFLDRHPHLGAGQVIEAELEIADKRVFNSLFTYFGNIKKSVTTPDGKYHVFVKADEESILSWCFALAGKVKLLSPLEAKKELQERASSLLGIGVSPNTTDKKAPFSQLDFKTTQDIPVFNPYSLTDSASSFSLEKDVSFAALLENKIVSLGQMQECFKLEASDVQDFVDLFLRSRKPQTIERLIISPRVRKPQNGLYLDFVFDHAGSLSFLGRGEQTVWLSLLFYWRLCYLGSQKCEEINPNWAFYFSKRLDPYLSKELRNKDGSPLLFVSSVSDELFSKPKIGGISYDWKAAIGVIDASCKNISINRLKTAIAKFEKICQFETVVI
jgi:hypothetical protein